ncbi:MAG: kelch repeat-containing protein, partial [Chitinophagales bacterium]
MEKSLQIICFLSFLFFLTSESFAQQSSWTWMKGDTISGSTGIFGTITVADSLNTPPALYEPCEWLDHQGKFWLFGGLHGVNEYGALWTYDPLANMWTWMHGLSSLNPTGSYGTKGVPAASNRPGSRFCASSWVDTSGNLWMYGGYGRTTNNIVGGLSDLWKYDINTNLWTWMSGFNTLDVTAVFGTQGMADSANTPGGRLETAATWVDDSNNLWLFGGILCCSASGDMNDIWKYNMSTSEWTWVKGSSAPNQLSVYGTKGVPAADNTPGGRRVYSHWKTADNKFWIFGGQQYSNDCYADLWRYDPETNEWTWMSGSSAANFTGSYGNICKPDSLNEPPARMENRFYSTDSCFNFWMFGGTNTVLNEYYNDAWYYNTSVNEWKWISGSDSTGENGFYGTQGVPGIDNHPGARFGGVAWQGPDQTFWLFGGDGLDFGQLNDLWRLQPAECIECSP